MRSPRALALLVVVLVLLDACALGAAPAEPATPAAAPVAAGDEIVGSTAVEAGATEATPAERVTITFAASEDFRSVYEPLIARFEAENPEVHVQLINLDSLLTPITMPDGSTLTTTEGSLRAIMSGADTAAVGADAEAIAKGWVRDLTPLIDADPTFDRADFYPGTLEASGRDGRIYMLPHTQFVDLFAYNKDLWAARGLPAPGPDWSWSDLKAATEQLAQKRGTTVEVYGMTDWENGYSELLDELATAGLPPDPSVPLRLDAPEVAEALERVAAMARSGALYIASGDSGAGAAALIRGQQIGIWPATPNMLPPGGPAPAFAIGTFLRPSAHVGVDGYTMSGGTLHPVEAWRWLAFLSRQGAVEAFWNTNLAGQVPARKSVAERTGYWKQLDAETAAVIQAALERPASAAQAAPDFGPHGFVQLRQALAAVVRGQSARDALRAAQAALEQEIAQEPTTSPETGPIVVATPLPEAPAEATRISFGTLRSSVDQVRRAAQAFSRSNPAIAVEVKNVQSTSGEIPPPADLAGQVDCFAGFGPPAQADLPALLDLQPLIDADAGFALDDYPAPLLAPFRRESALYGLPYAVELRVLNYDQTAFDAAGLAHPTAAWTMDDFLNAAQRLAGGTGASKRYGFASTVLQARDVFFFLDRFGATPVTGSGASLRPAFTDPGVVRALSAYLDLLRAYSPHQQLRGYTRGDWRNDAVELVAAGRVGMWFDFGASFFHLGAGEYQGFTHAIAPPPLGDTATADDFYARGMFISARTRQPAACWAWLKYLSGDLSMLEGDFPARRSLAESDAFVKQAPPGADAVYAAYRAAFERAPSGGSATEPRAQSPIDYYWFFRAIDRALQAKGGASDVLSRELVEAQTLTEQYLACVRGGATARSCATQVDPDYKGWNGSDRPDGVRG